MPRPPAGGVARYTGPTHTKILATVAANVRRLREERGLSQVDCATLCGGMSTYQLHLVETAQANFTASVLAQLCDGLGVEVADLFVPAAPMAKRKRGRPPKKVLGDAAE
jgi:transcriptional regulator with XRE-family HTH domain